LSEIHAKKVDLYLHQQGVDATTPTGKMLFQMMGVFAEFERTMIKERVMAGLARARAQGKQLGRPKVSAATEASIQDLRSTGMGKLKIARILGIGVSTVQRVVGDSPHEPSK
jgi:DNA invertase Pin-like site-specific DNA recombinase